MDFKTAVEHEDNNKPVMYQGHQYYVVGHELLCDECGKTFEVDTMVSYSWETHKMEEE